MRGTRLLRWLLAGLALCAGTAPAAAQTLCYETYFRYLGRHPEDGKAFYAEDVQGITHDGDAWYITNSNHDPWKGDRFGNLWRWPVGDDLAWSPWATPSLPPDVTRRGYQDVDDLANNNYVHFGPPSYYAPPGGPGAGYILIPISPGDQGPVIALFTAEAALVYRGRARLGSQQDAGWAAIDPTTGLVYSSESNAEVRTYRLDWARLAQTEAKITDDALTPEASFPLLDESGQPVCLDSMQGGVISPRGDLLYLVCGYLEDPKPSWGIHVFDMKTHRRIARSIDGDEGLFQYQFEPGWATYDEPEGLAIWDLDDGRAPGISGQLHVLVLNNNYTESDQVHLCHYTNVIHVNRGYAGEEEGTVLRPFRTVGSAIRFYQEEPYAFWDGAKIEVAAGAYHEPVCMRKRVELTAEGGTVAIGSEGRVILPASGIISIGTGGGLSVR